MEKQPKRAKVKKKLTPIDFERMWGKEGPYSQVRMCEEIRILDDSVSRTFLVVEAEVNPFTFEYIQKHRKEFVGDEQVLQLLDHAEYRGKFGYLVSAGEVEMHMPMAHKFAREQADMTTQTLIRMHTFIIDTFGLKKLKEESDKEALARFERRQAESKKDTGGKGNLIWSEQMGSVVRIDEAPSENVMPKTHRDTGRRNMTYVYVIIPFDKGFDFSKEQAMILGSALVDISEEFDVEIGDAVSDFEYMSIGAYIPANVDQDYFIYEFTDRCNMQARKNMFQEVSLITIGKKPTQGEIRTFLASVPQVGNKKKESARANTKKKKR